MLFRSAEKAALDPVRAREKPELARGDARPAVVVAVRRDDDALAVRNLGHALLEGLPAPPERFGRNDGCTDILAPQCGLLLVVGWRGPQAHHRGRFQALEGGDGYQACEKIIVGIQNCFATFVVNYE